MYTYIYLTLSFKKFNLLSIYRFSLLLLQRLPYSGLRNTLRNDCISGTGSRGRQEWVDLLRIVRNKPMTLKHRHLPEPFRTTFNVVQSTLVLMTLSPTSILHCLLPTLCVSVLFSLTHVPRTLTEDEIEKRNKKKEINKKLKGASKGTQKGTQKSTQKGGTKKLENAISTTDPEYYLSLAPLIDDFYTEKSNSRIPKNWETVINNAANVSKVPIVLVAEDNSSTSTSSYIHIERLFIRMRTVQGKIGLSNTCRKLIHYTVKGLEEYGYVNGTTGSFAKEYVDHALYDGLNEKVKMEEAVQNGDWVVLSDVDLQDSHTLNILETYIQEMQQRTIITAAAQTSQANVASSASIASTTGGDADTSQKEIVVAPQFRLFLLLRSNQNSATCCSSLQRLSLQSSRISFEKSTIPTLDILLPEHNMYRLGFHTFDLVTSYNSTTTNRDALVSDRRGYPRPKLLRTLADEIHRPASEEQLRQYRRLRFSLIFLHSRIVTYLASSSSSSGSSVLLIPNSDVMIDDVLRTASSLLRRRIMHHYCVFALGKQNDSFLQTEPGVDLTMVTW